MTNPQGSEGVDLQIWLLSIIDYQVPIIPAMLAAEDHKSSADYTENTDRHFTLNFLGGRSCHAMKIVSFCRMIWHGQAILL